MLDENLKSLMRRMDDLETELADKTDKLRKADRQNGETSNQLDCIYESHERKLGDLER